MAQLKFTSQTSDSESPSIEKMTMSNERNKNLFRTNVNKYFRNFCENTKIYGLNYLSEPGRTVAEKLYWTIFIVLSIYFSICTIMPMWTKWNQSPVVVLVQTHKSVWQVPFPAVTICPEIKVRQSVYNFTENYHKVLDQLHKDTNNLTSEELQQFADISLLCDNHLYTSGRKTIDNETLFKHITNVSPTLRNVLFSCKWLSLNQTCNDLFTPIVTEDGLCFTFNMLNKRELFSDKTYIQGDDNGMYSEGWSLEDGYAKNVGSDAHPKRTLTSGTSGGLFVLLSAYEHDLDYVCRGPVPGFKVIFHQPSETPRTGIQYLRAPLNQEIVMAIKPELLTTSQSLQNYDPHERGCFFSNERHLKFFRKYDQQNCKIECFANFTLAKCGCVAYHMPHEQSTKICGSGSNMCIYEAGQELLNQNAEENKPSCDCLPACTSLKYNAETSQADFHWAKVFQAFKTDINEFPGIQMTRLTIFFKDMQFAASQREELYDHKEFIALCGGVLALFCGFSFLSIAEIIYFLSIRLMCNVKKYGRYFWAGSMRNLTDSPFEE